ncbi:alkaline phosphatase family protein [Novosphingobium sp. Gsoil 351]|uniref:alkaline phosphatase family protein n=1 Tax=Novosphingobium sp. Gsoil 351 TaxID=2675225 RepID=UPI0012B4B6E5|nr:alkaline phosphatase family protein [Novosphingobium sp. Gsoil 351]QGN55436.1 alkaline phosphatase family protein [Novosphingobium sp. Gsoil 351]
MPLRPLPLFALGLLIASAASAQNAPPPPPKLIVAIAVDQFSADLFAEYRNRYAYGLKRLQQGAVFPAGYQGHAATETCPGHSTILTGVHPARTGIVANNWFDLGAKREKKLIYCAEDETQATADSKDYVASAVHLLVPTLGDRLKAANSATRNVAVSAKDRGALMMGGHAIDQVYWWKSAGFATLAGRQLGPSAVAENAAVAAALATDRAALDLPADCARADRAIQAGSQTVGTGRFERAKGDATRFRISPEMDAATADLAEKLVAEMDLGQGPATDVLSVSFSATDYVGHAFGTEGAEMCLQMHALDKTIGGLLDFLDARGIDYAVVLTADHGGFDVPERLAQQGLPQAARVDPALAPEPLGKAIAARLKIERIEPLLYADGPFGDFWLNRALKPKQRKAVLGELKALVTHPQVAAVFTAEELVKAPAPAGSPETWTLLDRARASFNPRRSGDVVVLLDRAIVPIPKPAPGYTATHGSPWDYDRRVPMLFWRKGMTGFEQPSPVETVDIAPTLAALVGLAVPEAEFDGRCLDLDAGPGNTCGERTR